MGLDNQNSNQIYPIQQHEQSQDFNINQSLRETTKSNITPNDSQKPNGKFGQSWENSNDNTGIFKEEHKQNEKDNLITPYKKQAQNDQPHNDQPPVSKKDVDQPAKPVNPTKKLMKYMKNERWLFFWSTIALVLGNAGQFAVPYYIGLFVDNMKDEKFDDIPSLCYQLVGIIFVIIQQSHNKYIQFSSIAVFYRGMYYSVISEKIARNLRQDLYESLVNKDVEFFDSRKTGDLLSRIGSDTAVIQEGLSTNVSMFLRSFIFIIVSFIFLFILSWQLTLAMIASIMPVILFSVFYGNMMKNAQKHIQDGKAYISTLAEETFSNIRTVKAFATEKEETLRYSKGNDTVYKYGYYKSFWYGIFNFFANFFVFGSMAVIVGLGSKLYQDGEITIGEITAFLFYMMQILMNFMILASVLGSVMSIIGASVKIVEILEYIPKINTSGGNKIEGQIIGEVTIRDVKFHYPTKKDVQVLKGVTIDIKKNRVVALVGPSGCGKSSLISMIERFYDPIEGVVEFDGVDVKTLDPKWYHSQVAIVQQEPVLFSGSIKENIGYGLPEDQVTEETLDWACKQANAYEFIHDKDLFPEGYSTIVGERGVKLSGGQKQRIAIARALIRKPKILLLDEATSALDAESEHQVQKALDELIKSGEQTIIVIAHRLSTIRDADEIIVIRKGEVAERGSHEELLKKGGVYKSLVERQLMSMQLEEK
ncbi:abc transporter b family protein [Stylonychia lemnae]|uniref:Abc transporter b family protein n=1 Tax=Stylonychia lemnae TaxID=5949 RepID=A0A078ADX3_STYLE|nr:abc transporter b family protein [Stylonychia lemnae]|eukprot:CDW80051.1 abc transporter b family protein [Stylonychia lemnae]